MKPIVMIFIICSLFISHYVSLAKNIERRRRRVTNVTKLQKLTKNNKKASGSIEISLNCIGDQWKDKINYEELISLANTYIDKKIEDATKKNKPHDFQRIDNSFGDMRITRMRILETNKFYMGGDHIQQDQLSLGYAICLKSCPQSIGDDCLKDKKSGLFKDKKIKAHFFYIEKCVSQAKVRVVYIGQDTNCRDAVKTATPWFIGLFQTSQISLMNIDIKSNKYKELKEELDKIIAEAKKQAEETGKAVQEAVNEIVQESLNQVLSAIGETIAEEAAWGVTEVVLTCLDCVPILNTISIPIHIAVIAAHVASISNVIKNTAESIKKLTKILKEIPFQQKLQNTKIKASNPTVDLSGQKYSKLSNALEAAKLAYPHSKRSFKDFISSINCAMSLELSHTTVSERELFMGLYNEVASEKDTETFLTIEKQAKYTFYYHGCKLLKLNDYLK